MCPDPFAELARYYDPLMAHVDYDRWFVVATAVAEALGLKTPPRHLDLACGTGTLLARLRVAGWASYGADLSPAMLRIGRKARLLENLACADMTALPFRGCFDYVTCLFDSVNFLADDTALDAAFRAVADALAPGGLFYFDCITERMVTEHFAGQQWHETNKGFTSGWHSRYDPNTALAETRITINRRAPAIILEKIFSLERIAAAARDAGLEVLGSFDAESWRPPGKRSIRVDFVAGKQVSAETAKRFAAIAEDMQGMFV